MFLYADYSPQLLAAVAAGEMPSDGKGWNACAMSYGTHALPANLTDVWTGNICARGSSVFSMNGCNPTA